MTHRHGNLIENAPLALLLLAVTEIEEWLPKRLILATGGVFLMFRLSHAYSFLYLHEPAKHLRFRVFGMIGTISFTVAYSGLVIYHGVRNLF